MTQLSLSLVVADPGLQIRAALNFPKVQEYKELLTDGDKTLPPVTVFKDSDGKHWLADGFHRLAAHQQAGRATIPANVRAGTRRDALKHALGANADHGLPRSNADKRRAVVLMVEDAEWGQLSDREVAKVTGTTHPFVGKIRRELKGEIQPEPEPEPVTVTTAAPVASIRLDWPEDVKGRGEWIKRCSDLETMHYVCRISVNEGYAWTSREHRGNLERVAGTSALPELLNAAVGLLGHNYPQNRAEVSTGLERAILVRIAALADRDGAPDPADPSDLVASNAQAAEYLRYRELGWDVRARLLGAWILCERANPHNLVRMLKHDLPAALRDRLQAELDGQRADEQERKERGPVVEHPWVVADRLHALLDDDQFEEDVGRTDLRALRYLYQQKLTPRRRGALLQAMHKKGDTFTTCPDLRCNEAAVPDGDRCPFCGYAPEQATNWWKHAQKDAWKTLRALGFCRDLILLLKDVARQSAEEICPICFQDQAPDSTEARHNDDCPVPAALRWLPQLETPEESEGGEDA